MSTFSVLVGASPKKHAVRVQQRLQRNVTVLTAQYTRCRVHPTNQSLDLERCAGPEHVVAAKSERARGPFRIEWIRMSSIDPNSSARMTDRLLCPPHHHAANADRGHLTLARPVLTALQQ